MRYDTRVVQWEEDAYNENISSLVHDAIGDKTFIAMEYLGDHRLVVVVSADECNPLHADMTKVLSSIHDE